MGKVDQNKFSKSKGIFHHHRKEINKKTKINLVFDSNARKDYLLGFRKRKQERAEHYKKKIETKLVAEKKRIKEKAKEKGKSSSHSILPEVEDLLGLKKKEEEDEEESQVFEVGSKTVTISSLHGIFPKRLESSSESEDNNEEDLLDDDENSAGGGNGSESDQETTATPDGSTSTTRRGPLTKSEKASVNKDVVRLLQKSKPFKTMQRMKQKKSKNKKSKKKKMSGNKAKNVKVKNNRRTRQ